MVFRGLLAGILLGLVWNVAPAQTATPNIGDVLEGILSQTSGSEHENKDLNYRLSLPEGYRPFRVGRLVPGADFGALRTDPNVFFAVTVEKLGPNVSMAQYRELVVASTVSRLNSDSSAHLGATTMEEEYSVAGLSGLRWEFSGTLSDHEYAYITTIFTHGGYAYQIFGSSPKTAAVDLSQESTNFMSGFALVDADSVTEASSKKSINDYSSLTYGYRLRAKDRHWYLWADADEQVPTADLAALSNRGAGMATIPVCWEFDSAPHRDAVTSTLLGELGIEYSSDFVQSESAVTKNGVAGSLIQGQQVIDGDDFFYKLWMVQNENCAHLLAVWVVDRKKILDEMADPFWQGLAIAGNPTAKDGKFLHPDERDRNASLINRIGLHYYNARNYRKAFQYFEAAYESTQKETFFTNALQTLSDLEALAEAYAWGKDHFPKHRGPEAVSWHAWLLSQNAEPDRALEEYRYLFDSGHRDDEDFEIYAELLAEHQQFEILDELFKTYSEKSLSPKLRTLQATLLSKRGSHDQALEILAELEKPGFFDPELTYARIEVLQNLQKPAEILALAETLLDEGYGSAQAYYYKGDAEYELGWYEAARTSMSKALEYAPRNKTLQGYLQDINAVLGDGNSQALSEKMEPVPLPRGLQKRFENPEVTAEKEGFDSYYLTRLRGYRFDKEQPMTRTDYRQIRIQNNAGVERFGTIELDFDPSYERLYVNELKVLDETGELVAEGNLRSYYVSDKESDQASFDQTAHLPVPNLRPGHTIQLIVSIQKRSASDEFPVAEVFLSTDRPIDQSGVFVVGEVDDLKYQTSGLGEPRGIPNGIAWVINDPTIWRWEPMLPDYKDILDWVQLGTTDDDWRMVGVNYLADIQDKLDSERVKNKAASLIRGVSDPLRRVEILSHYVQREIHYKALEFGRRAIIPKTARETISDRYGDCKDHATLLFALLQSVDIPASLALVNLSSRVNPNLPNLDQFDHMVVFVPDIRGGIYLDATDKDSNLTGAPPRGLGNQYALILDDDPSLVAIPQYPDQSSQLIITRDVIVGGKTPMKISEHAQFSGYVAAELRSQLKSIETSQLRDSLQSWLSDQYDDAELQDFFVENIFEPEHDLLLELVYTLPGEDIVDTLETPTFLEREYLDYQRFSDKRFPFRQKYPFELRSKTRVRADTDQLTVPVLDPVVEERSDFASWTRRADVVGDDLELSFVYVGQKGQFEAKEYDTYHQFHRRLVEKIGVTVTLE